MSSPPFDFDAVFGADYLHFYGPALEEVADADAEAVWDRLELRPGTEVLDLACGHGRIANRLAARGARVAGLDATPGFLALARRDAAARGVAVEYVEGDMRALPWPDGRFERVLSWFTSFGYFGDDDNRLVLREAHRVLRPGGRLLIEGNNLAQLLPRWLPSTVAEREGDLAIDRARFDPVTGRATTERVVIRDRAVRRSTFSVRLFMPTELRDWLLGAGFAAVGFVEPGGGPLGPQSRRMIAVAGRG